MARFRIRGAARFTTPVPAALSSWQGAQAADRARATADVGHVASAELRGHRRVDLEVGAIRVQRVMERREAGVLVVRVGHAGRRQTPAVR